MKIKNIYRPTWAEIDLGALRYNYKRLKNIVAKDVKALCVVKADAYGHGLIEVSHTLVGCGIDYLGVSSIDEAIKLRRSSIHCPILIFENILPANVEPVVDYNLTQTICSKEVARALNNYAAKRKRRLKVHIKVDTGMGRLGVWHKEAFDFIKDIKKLPFISIEGVYSHLSSAETDRRFTDYQIRQFESLIKKVRRSDIGVSLFHIANSAGAIQYRHGHFNMVRFGLMLYGIYPKDDFQNNVKLKPVMSLKSKIIYLKRVPRGRSIGYVRTFITSRPSTIATIPVGYKDGYSRSLSNKSEVLIRGERCRVLGKICMDQLMVDVSGIKGVKNGDIVILIGSLSKECIYVEELADLAGTIAYEIVCNIGNSVVRIYKDN